MTRIPLDIWEKWFGKKKKIEERIKFTTGKTVRVPMTAVLGFYGSQQRYEWDDNVIPYFLGRKHRKKMQGTIV